MNDMDWLERETALVEVSPDLRRRFPRLLRPGYTAWYGDVSLGNLTMFRVGLTSVTGPRGGRRLFVGVESQGAFGFDHSFVTANYVKEKLTMGTLGDAENMADFINDQLDGLDEQERAVRQGTYLVKLCAERGWK